MSSFSGNITLLKICSNINKAINTISNNIVKLENLLKIKDTQINNLTAIININSNKITDLNNDLQTINENIDFLKKDVEILQKATTINTDNLVEHEKNILKNTQLVNNLVESFEQFRHNTTTFIDIINDRLEKIDTQIENIYIEFKNVEYKDLWTDATSKIALVNGAIDFRPDNHFAKLRITGHFKDSSNSLTEIGAVFSANNFFVSGFSHDWNSIISGKLTGQNLDFKINFYTYNGTWMRLTDISNLKMEVVYA